MSGPSGRQLQLKFNDFSLEPYNDVLIIRDGHSETSRIIHSLNGSTLPADVVSRGNSFFVEFISDAHEDYHGFQLEYLIYGKLLPVR